MCYVKCPARSLRTAVSTCTHRIKWRGNTHLRVVNQALELLKKANVPAAKRAVQVLTASNCRKAWETGLWEVDNSNLADSPGKAMGAHFYNVRHIDGRGSKTKSTTYLIAGIDQTKHGNAASNAKARLAKAGNLSTAAKCRQFGNALHYVTDITQPIHSSSFSGISVPTQLHPVWEDYVPTVQANFKATGWNKHWTQSDPGAMVDAASVHANEAMAGLMKSVKYKGTICTATPQSGITYTGDCFFNVPAANAAIGRILVLAYQSTARYILAVFKSAPKK